MDRYTSLVQIGEGGYGRIMRARDSVNGGREVVLKMFKNEHIAEEGVPFDCLREVAALRACGCHPNVIQMHDVQLESQVVFAVLEPMAHDLHTHYRCKEDAGTPLRSAERLRIIGEVAAGLAHVHAQGHMHRDLKPGNVLIGYSGEVKLADFGLARPYVPGRAYTMGMCTLWYRAPEMLLGAEVYGQEVDMWSLGCIHAEITRGSPILTGENDSHQLLLLCRTFGRPTLADWPGVNKLPHYKQIVSPVSHISSLSHLCIRSRSATEVRLMAGLLVLNPAKRLTARSAASYAQKTPVGSATRKRAR
jgi:cell division cycle 2-like protein